MHFSLVDEILELSADRIVAVKNVTAAEEYLQDHFPTFPVLPGVLMIEALAQAARRLLVEVDGSASRHVLGEVRALKYGSFVRPGQALRVEVSLLGRGEDGSASFRGQGTLLGPGSGGGSGGSGEGEGSGVVCVSGRFVLRPARLGDG